MNEIWKDVSGYDVVYQISNLGRLKRVFKNGAEHFLVGVRDKDGYVKVILSKSQNKKHFRLHRLVAEAFIPNPTDKPVVNHKDKNTQNNKVTNLEWVTVSENVIHGYLTGRNVHKRAVAQYTRDMELISLWDSMREASKQLGISEHNICSCCNGKLKTSGGYIWRYREVSI